MTNLINRIALFISMLFGFFITFCIFWALWELEYISGEEIFFVIILTVIFWAIFKKVFLAEDFIRDAVNGLVDRIKEESLVQIKEVDVKTLVKEKKEKTQKERIQEITEKIEDKEVEERFIPRTQPEEIVIERVSLESRKVNRAQEEKREDLVSDKINKAIKDFFSENLLAKIGSILVFLSVVFLMSLIWDKLPANLKILIGFVIWFSIFGVWVVLDNKKLKWESRILLWAWILINYAVILAWRYLLDDGGYLSEWIALLFLILNTIFAIITSLVYKSKTLLLFSFIFAYLNPLLVWGKSETPYTLVWYSMIVSIWAMFLWIKQKNDVLKYSAFVWWNLLFLIAPFQTDIWWIIKLVSSAILWVITIFSIFNKVTLESKNKTENLSSIFVVNYIFIVLLLVYWWSRWVLWEVTSFISYMVSIVFFFAIWIYLFINSAIRYVKLIFIIPLLIILGLTLSWTLFSAMIGFSIIVLVYLIWFVFTQSSSESSENLEVSNSTKYVLFIILWIFIAVVNGFNIFFIQEVTFIKVLTISIVSFIFLFTSYYFSTKKSLWYLYSIGTFFWILILLSVINLWLSTKFEWTQIFNIWILSLVLFTLSNWLLPFINKNLTTDWENTKNLIIWNIIWILFISFELYLYWERYFPGLTTWYAFAGLSIVYFILGYFMLNELWVEKVKSEIPSRNTIYTYIGLSITLFSLATALVFSKHPEVISTVWLFEASVLFYFFSKTKEPKVFAGWLILFVIWVINLGTLLGVVEKREFMFLIPFAIIFASFVLNLSFFKSIESEKWIEDLHVFHDIIHIVWIWMLAWLLSKIIPTTGHGWSMFWITSFIFVLSVIYSYFNSKLLKWVFTFVFIMFLLMHIQDVDQVIARIDRDNVWYLRILQYLTTIILWAVLFVWDKMSKERVFNKFLNGWFTLYILVILSTYILDIFNTTFAVTLFWWVVSFILLSFGINMDRIKYRTMWLYLLGLVLWKIFIYDIWRLTDWAVSRVIALMVTWIMLIIVSTMYSKKYWANLKWEFDFNNLFSEKSKKINEK